MDLAIIIPVKNEESAIADTVRRAAGLGCVYVVDSSSTDKTVALAEQAGANVVNFVWSGGYPKKKQWCLENVGLDEDWVLFLDADEAVDPRLAAELAAHVPRPTDAAYDVCLRYVWQGRELHFGHRVIKRSLVHRHRVRFPVVDDLGAPGMGEQEGHYQPICDGTVSQLQGRIIHDDRDGFGTWVARHNRYSDWQAYIDGDSARVASIRAWKSPQGRRLSASRFRGSLFFVYSYILRLGFLDGRAGLDYALANAFYYWIVSVKRRESLGP